MHETIETGSRGEGQIQNPADVLRNTQEVDPSDAMQVLGKVALPGGVLTIKVERLVPSQPAFGACCGEEPCNRENKLLLKNARNSLVSKADVRRNHVGVPAPYCKSLSN